MLHPYGWCPYGRPNGTSLESVSLSYCSNDAVSNKNSVRPDLLEGDHTLLQIRPTKLDFCTIFKLDYMHRAICACTACVHQVTLNPAENIAPIFIDV